MTHEQMIEVNGSPMPLLLFLPETSSPPRPAVLICHHREGVDTFTRHAGELLAKNGFIVAIPNFYHRRPANESWQISRKTVQDIEVVADLQAAAELVRGLPEVKSDAIGIIGHCMGGRTAFLGAAATANFKATVMLYGGNIFKEEGVGMPAPIALAGNITCKLLGLYGHDDHIIAPDEVARLSAELRRLTIDHEFHIYPGVGHAFQDFERVETYNQNVSDEAWKRVLEFLKANL